MKYVLLFFVIAAIVYVCLLNEYGLKHIPEPRLVKKLPPPRRAMTIPPFGILMKDDEAQETIKKHEKCHWEQYQKLGLFPFYASYFSGYLKYGYRNSPMEEECYSKQYD